MIECAWYRAATINLRCCSPFEQPNEKTASPAGAATVWTDTDNDRCGLSLSL
jgi:gamma-glutamylcysteine synthetase